MVFFQDLHRGVRPPLRPLPVCRTITGSSPAGGVAATRTILSTTHHAMTQPAPSSAGRRMAVLSALLFAGLAPIAAQVKFRDITSQSGISFIHTDNAAVMGGGVCVIDFDNDGFNDIYATRGATGANQLFRNMRNGTFTNVTQAAGVGLVANSSGAYAADLDNDGDQDLLVLTIARTLLYRNNGDGTFTDVTTPARINNSYWGMSITFADYDNDGDLDFYCGNYIFDGFFPHFDGAPNQLFRNEGNLRFTNVSKAAGVEGHYRFWDSRGYYRATSSCTLSVLFHDYDSDGWMDIFVGNDFGPFILPDMLFRNNRDGTFSEVAASAGFKIAEFNMGLATADVNGDQIPDLYTTNLGDNHLLLSNGRGQFFDVTKQWGALEGTDNNKLLTSWAPLFLDCDLDCVPDLYVSNGFVPTVPAMDNSKRAPSRLLRNDGRQFSWIPTADFPWDRDVGRGAARADIDGDGDEDIIQLNNRGPLRLYSNETQNNNDSAILDLSGSLSNRDGIGAIVKIRTRQATQVIEYNRGGSYLSSNGTAIIAGLGRDPQIDELSIKWPSGVEQKVHDLARSQRHQIVEPTVTAKSIGAFKGIGMSYVEIPVTVTNHSPVPEKTSFEVELSLGMLRAKLPTHFFPVTMNPNETRTVPVYVPIRAQDLPLAAQLGIWMKVTTRSRTAAVDSRRMPLR